MLLMALSSKMLLYNDMTLYIRSGFVSCLELCLCPTIQFVVNAAAMSDDGKRKTFKFLTPWKAGGGNANSDQGDAFMSSSKPGRPRAVAPAATSRQAQNRTAQRAYRERKERYVKDLEREVQRLRAEAARVHALNEEMSKKLRESGTGDDSLPPYFKSDQNTKEAKTAYLFVCKLESICADHFDFPKDSKDSHGHQLLISHPDNPNKGAAALLKAQMQNALNSYSAGNTLVTSSNETQSQDHPLSVDYLSSVFGIKEESLSPHTASHSHSHSSSPSYMANEITPVQVWEKVSTHPQLQNLNLTSICNYLRQKAKCHGYGAVIEQEEVDYILEVEYGLSLEQQKQIEQMSGLSLQPVQRPGQDLPPTSSETFEELQFSPSMAQFSDGSNGPSPQNNMSPESFAYQSFEYSPQTHAQQYTSASPGSQYNPSHSGQLQFDSASPEGYSEAYPDFQVLPTMQSQSLELDFSNTPGNSANPNYNPNTSSENILYSSQQQQDTSGRSKFKLGKGYVD